MIPSLNLKPHASSQQRSGQILNQPVFAGEPRTISRRGFLAGALGLAGTVAASKAGFFSWVADLWEHGEIFQDKSFSNIYGKPENTFCFIGDFGRGANDEDGADAVQDIAARMYEDYQASPYHTVFTVGDNIYPDGNIIADGPEKFEKPFADLLKTKAKWYAALGNHDVVGGYKQDQLDYPLWNMKGRPYYKVSVANGDVDVFMLDPNDYVGARHMSHPITQEQRELALQQTRWLDAGMKASTAKWKIVVGHFPIYHSDVDPQVDRDRMQFYKAMLTPVLEKYGASFMSGHEHGYEHFKPVNGVKQIITGGGGAALREFDHPTNQRPLARIMQNQYLKCVVDGDELKFVSISRDGKVIDGGTIPKSKPASQIPNIDVDSVWRRAKNIPAFA